MSEQGKVSLVWARTVTLCHCPVCDHVDALAGLLVHMAREGHGVAVATDVGPERETVALVPQHIRTTRYVWGVDPGAGVSFSP